MQIDKSKLAGDLGGHTASQAFNALKHALAGVDDEEIRVGALYFVACAMTGLMASECRRLGCSYEEIEVLLEGVTEMGQRTFDQLRKGPSPLNN